jgi:uncharacterized delta-60 repeat protein
LISQRNQARNPINNHKTEEFRFMMRHSSTQLFALITTTLLGLAVATWPVAASPLGDGILDPTFGNNGTRTTELGGYAEGRALAIQADGKLLVAGYAAGVDDDDFTLVRYLSDGTLDLSFDSDGSVTTDLGAYDYGYALTIQDDGKILIAGYSGSDNIDFALVRYSSDGALDVSFDSDGIVTTDLGSDDYARAVGVQSDGKIIVAGYSGSDNLDFALVRYNSNGTLDTSFDSDGIVTSDFGGEDNGRAVAIQADGKLLVAGYAAGVNNDDFAVVRYNSDGTPDLSFDNDGQTSTDLGGNDEGHALALQSDGKIVVAGSTSSGSDFAVVRYNSDGTLDTNFDSDGKTTVNLGGNDYGYAMALQSDERIVVAGSSGSDFALARYHNNGTLDTSFATNGKTTTDLGGQDASNAVALQSDGKIVSAGKSTGRFALARYTSANSTPTPTSTPSSTPTATATVTPAPTDDPLAPTPVPNLPPSNASTNVLPNQAASLVYNIPNGGSIAVEVPVGAVQAPTTLLYQTLSTPTATLGAYQLVGHAFMLHAYQDNAIISPFVFGIPVTVTLSYTEDDVAGMDEMQFQLLTLDVTTGQWSTDGITVIERNLQDNRLVVTIAHFTEFTLTMPPWQVFMPLINKR